MQAAQDLVDLGAVESAGRIGVPLGAYTLGACVLEQRRFRRVHAQVDLVQLLRLHVHEPLRARARRREAGVLDFGEVHLVHDHRRVLVAREGAVRRVDVVEITGALGALLQPVLDVLALLALAVEVDVHLGVVELVDEGAQVLAAVARWRS